MCARQLTYPVLVGFFLAGVVTAQETVQSPDQHALFSTVFYPASAENRTSVAFKPLHRWLVAAPEDEAREILAMLRAEITTTNSPDNVFSAGILLSRRPDLTSAAVVLDAIEIRAGVETRLDSAAMCVHKHVQARLWEALANMLCRLSPADRDVLADGVIDNASKVISSPGEWQLVSEGAVSCLPCLGDVGFRLLDAIARDPDRRRRAGDALPWELSQTGDPRALETIVLLYDVGRRGRGCTGSLHAMGNLTARLDKAGVPVPEASRAAAWLRIQQHLLDEDDQ
ncbi:MAG: hypothetical protein JXA69_06225, partial [Phycisphaerae bacterium]|nr:hypothetical protein [Phycisphaerae bacterium]